MLTQFRKHWQFLPKAFQILIASLFALGLFFRFAYIGDRPYWHDEAHTLLRVSGYTLTEVTQDIFDGRVISRNDILKYQNITPEKSLLNTVDSLIREEPHRMPLYYVLTRLWMQVFGNSLTATRSLSVLISLLIFPALYWLCSKLFQQPLTSWIAIALVTISPFHVHYAQEIREYGLWSVTLLLMCAAFLRAIRLNTRPAWMLYTTAIALSLYTFFFSAMIALGNGFYLIAVDQAERMRKAIAVLKATLFGGLIFSPWLLCNVLNFSEVQERNAWMKQPIPIKSLIQQWMTNFQLAFFKDDISGSLRLVFAGAFLLLVGAALYNLIRQSPKGIWIFIFALIFPLFLALAIPDLILGGIRSTNSRYFVPCYLGIQIAVAHLLASRLIQTRLDVWKQAQWKLITSLLITIGVLSCTIQMIQNRVSEDRIMAQLINDSSSAIVISNEASKQGGGTIGDIFVLSHLVNSDTRFQLVIAPNLPEISQSTNLFLYKPLPFLKEQLSKKYRLEAVYKDKLFRLNDSNPV